MDEKRAAVGAVLLSSFFWGSSFAVASASVDFASPVFSLLLRFFIAAPLAIGVMLFLKIPLRATLTDSTVWVLGILNAAAFMMQYGALVWTSATNVALLISMDLIFVGVGAAIILGETVTWRLGVSVFLGLVGVVLVETGMGSASVSFESLKGDLLALGAGLTWTAYILLSKKSLSEGNKMSAEQLTVGVCVSTTVPLMFLIPFANVGETTNWPLVLMFATYLAVFTTILSYFLWYKGLKVLPATVTSVLLLLEIAFAAILAYVFLGERVGLGTIIGGTLICTAAVMAALSPQK